MKILAIAGSNSDTSINRQLVTYAASLFENEEIEVVDMNDFEMPIYKHQREVESGVPHQAKEFAAKIDSADVLLISLSEHNGTYTTAFKNVFDWTSRIKERAVWNEVPMILMATAPGARGGLGVLEAAEKRFPLHGGNIIDTFTLPFFNDNFDKEAQKISNFEKDTELKEKINKISQVETILEK
ncbi:NADPH-dependent FMN reductase [Chryseobacterium chendengshani]|uniref:NADPH-dependent FMN reductase n=1 Tax=unclassified Chryseobacterium TaxID=2593645 RepID=UPI001C63D873|nr:MULTISPECIES: NAD(P)H-dependent oxidoreductase [unclassified Chryseobacterium]MBW7674056.1 NAD(P)H-dependent oxidoreductase [Chryseobacterium sp. LJ756]MBW8523002.1 NAD(P)H-dependent oxidoreductase [Chryseobacterium sp. LJ668]QYK16531.1 NAD(P)H-dependent oxidoreductase [Chryseobacterium sp. LJ668]